MAGRFQNIVHIHLDRRAREHLLNVLILMLCVLIAVSVFYFVTGNLSAALLAAPIVVIIPCVAFWWIAWLDRAATRDLAMVALAEGVCPQCAYRISESSAECDGRVRCPECSATWAVEGTRPTAWGGPECRLTPSGSDFDGDQGPSNRRGGGGIALDADGKYVFLLCREDLRLARAACDNPQLESRLSSLLTGKLPVRGELWSATIVGGAITVGSWSYVAFKRRRLSAFLPVWQRYAFFAFLVVSTVWILVGLVRAWRRERAWAASFGTIRPKLLLRTGLCPCCAGDLSRSPLTVRGRHIVCLICRHPWPVPRGSNPWCPEAAQEHQSEATTRSGGGAGQLSVMHGGMLRRHGAGPVEDEGA